MSIYGRMRFETFCEHKKHVGCIAEFAPFCGVKAAKSRDCIRFGCVIGDAFQRLNCFGEIDEQCGLGIA